MSATIKYKGETIATASNNTKTLLTAGKYMEANVVVTDTGGGGGATLQTKSVSYTPSETAISDAVLPDAGYDGMDRVNVSVGAIDPNYVGSEVPVRDSSNLTVSDYDEYVTADAGYYPNAVTKYLTPKLKPSPVVSLNTSNGRVTATATYSASDDTVGYHDSGTATGSLQLVTRSARTYTPTTADQTISSGQYLIGNQTILGDADLVAGNIKKDVNIFGVTGTYEGSGATLQTRSVTIVPTETATTQTVTPSSGYDGLSQVTVNVGAISSTYVGSEVPRNDSTDVYRQSHFVGIPEGYYADDVIYEFPLASTPTIDTSRVDSTGKVTVDVEINNGGYIGAGTYQATDSVALPTQAAQTITPGTTDQEIASGKWLTGTQTILGDANLIAENIKKDVRIFGVTGTYEGGSGGGVTWGEIGSTSVTPSVRNLYAALADSSIEFGSFILASTPTNAFVDLFTLTSITAPCKGIVIIDDAFYQGASGLPNNGNSEAISYAHFSKAFLNPAKENALASASPCYGYMAWGVSQTNTSGQAGGQIGANPFDGASLIMRGYFQWNGQTLQWKSQYGGQQYTTFVAGRTYRWIAY